MPHIEKIFGPPGTGKTATLIGLLQKYLADGVPPDRIGYLAFTVKAATEAKERAVQAVKGLHPNDLVWFKTIHAFCYRVGGYERVDIMQKGHYSQLCKSINVDYSGFVDLSEGDVAGELLGDRLVFFEGLVKARDSDLRTEFDKGGIDCTWGELQLFSTALDQYKRRMFVDDFNDMLRNVAFGSPKLPELDVLFVDEAQDLSKLQWLTIERIMSNVQHVYFAGDDDQAIFNWAGAASELFLELPGTTTVLGHSYRLPKRVHGLAQRLAGSIRHRQDKQFTPRDSEGDVQYRTALSDLDLDRGSWLILARNSYLLKEAYDLCYQEGYSYDGRRSPIKAESLQAIKAYETLRAGQEVSDTDKALVRKYGADPSTPVRIWHEAFTKLPSYESQYFLAARKRGESLNHPRIKISTIHGAKGGEADNVVVYSDMAYRSYNGMLDDPDAEQRVFYVAATRAKENLFIMEPTGSNFFTFPHS